MPDSTLSFLAEDVGADTTEYTPECVVYLIAFGEGDPAANGHCWTFSRSFDDDWGVCTVREIQKATVYGGIERFMLLRSGVECVFGPKAAAETGYRELTIAFTIDDKTWREIAETAKVVSRDCPYFTLIPPTKISNKVTHRW
jgi:hypothetical protein